MRKTRLLYLEKKTGSEIVAKYNSLQDKPGVRIVATNPPIPVGNNDVGWALYDAFIYYESDMPEVSLPQGFNK